MDKFYITHQTATGISSYRLIHNNTEIISNSVIALPERQPSVSKDLITGRELITCPIPSSEYPTIVPGLKNKFDVCDEYGNIVAVFEQEYGEFCGYLVKVYIKNRCIFIYSPVYPPPDAYINAYEGNSLACEGTPIAVIENDTTFKYDPRSIDDKRHILQLSNDKYMEYLPYIFHVYVSDKMGVLT